VILTSTLKRHDYWFKFYNFYMIINILIYYLLVRIVCFDISSGEKVHEITHPDMQTVYAIKYDPMNQVLHAATGDNHRAEASGFTFDASKENFGKFLDKWAAEDRV
jgi:hypothetical protein